MSNQGPNVETDPKKIAGLIGRIETAIREYEQALKQFTEKDNVRIKEIMKDRMNRFIESALKYAMQGDPSTYCGPYPKWIVDNQSQLQTWLDNPNTEDSVKQQINSAKRQALGIPEPTPSARPPSPQAGAGDLESLIRSAVSLDELIKVVENYPNDITSKSGDLLDKPGIVEVLKAYARDENMVQQFASDSPPLHLLSSAGVTSNYGLRDRFVQLAKEKHAENVFVREIKAAATMADFERIILSYPYDIRYSNGQVVPKQQLIDTMRDITRDRAGVEAIARGEQVQSLAGVTRQYGLREKFVDLIKKQVQEQNLTAARQPQAGSSQSSGQRQPDASSFASQAIDALNMWFMVRNIKSQDVDRANVQSMLRELSEIQVKNLAPDIEKAEVLACLDKYPSHIRFNVKRGMGYDQPRPDAGHSAQPGPSAQQKPPSAPPRAQPQPQAEDPIKKAISKINETMLWAIQRNDQRYKWTEPLREKLEAIDISKASPAEKREQAVRAVTEMYFSAKQDPITGFNASRIAADILTEVFKVPVPDVPMPQAPKPAAQGPIPPRAQPVPPAKADARSQSQEDINKENKGPAAATIAALESWFWLQDIRSQAADRINKEKLVGDLKAIQAKKLSPEVEKSQVMACLDRYPSHFKFNVVHALENWKPAADTNKGRPLPKSPRFDQFRGAPGDAKAGADPLKKEPNINVDPRDNKRSKPN